MIDWGQDLELFLIRAGVTGVKQMDIVRKFQNVAGAEELEDYLMALASEDKVQRFTVPCKGRSYKLWRATVKLV